MTSIIQYLLIQNQYLLQIISFLFKFICKYIPLRQGIFDDSNSPEYQKFKVDEPPLIKKPVKVWYYKDFLAYIKWKYDIDIKPVKRRSALGYRVSDNRGVGPCILAMRMAFREFKIARKL